MQSWLTAAIWLVIIHGLFSSSVLAQSGATLRGFVTDASGAVLGARIVVREDAAQRTSPSRQMIVVDTDTFPRPAFPTQGRFTIGVEPGFYDVCVMSDGFVPHCDKIRVRESQTLELQFELKLDERVLAP